MKKTLLTTLLAAFAAMTMYGQTNTAAAKLPSSTTPATPTLDTSKLWRLANRAASLRVQSNQLSKDADAADVEAKAESERLAGICAAAKMVLSYDERDHSAAPDVVCVVPKPPTPTPPPVDAKPVK